MDSLKKWKALIGQAGLIQNKLMQLDKENMYEYYCPKIAATEEQINEAQAKIGFELPKDYKDFLLCANGWNGFYLDVDLFGTNELTSSRVTDALNLLLDVVVEHFPELEKRKNAILPIAQSREDRNIFIMYLSEDEYYGKVLWLDGQEIDLFDSFEQFFCSMVLYNKEDVDEYERTGKNPFEDFNF